MPFKVPSFNQQFDPCWLPPYGVLLPSGSPTGLHWQVQLSHLAKRGANREESRSGERILPRSGTIGPPPYWRLTHDLKPGAFSFFRTRSPFPEWPIYKGRFSAEQRQLALGDLYTFSFMALSCIVHFLRFEDCNQCFHRDWVYEWPNC